MDGSSDTGLIAHAQKYHSPIGIVVYDSHGNRIAAPWAKAPLEDGGHVSGLFGAEAGYAVMKFPVFGAFELRYFVIGSSSTAPMFLGRQKIFAYDCDTTHRSFDLSSPLATCDVPNQIANGSVTCDATIAGALCQFECDDGFILSHLDRSRLLCLSSGTLEAPLPACIPLETAAQCTLAREGEVCVLAADMDSFPFGVCSNASCVSRASLASKSVLAEFESGSHRNALRLWAEGVRQKHASLHKQS